MDTGNYIAIAGTLIALVGALVALLGTRLTYKAALRGLENQRLLADREAAGSVLDNRSVELADIDSRLKELDDCLSEMSKDAIQQAREDHLPSLRKVAKTMEREQERLRIRFRSSVAESFGLASTSVLSFLESESVQELNKVVLRKRFGPDVGDQRAEREASFQDFMDTSFPQVVQGLSKSRGDVTSARSGFRNAAYEIIGIGKEQNGTRRRSRSSRSR